MPPLAALNRYSQLHREKIQGLLQTKKRTFTEKKQHTKFISIMH